MMINKPVTDPYEEFPMFVPTREELEQLASYWATKYIQMVWWYHSTGSGRSYSDLWRYNYGPKRFAELEKYLGDARGDEIFTAALASCSKDMESPEKGAFLRLWKTSLTETL